MRNKKNGIASIISLFVFLGLLYLGWATYANAEPHVNVTQILGQVTRPMFVADSTGTDVWWIAPNGNIFTTQDIYFESGTGFTIQFDHTATANRIITFPDVTATVLTTSDSIHDLINVTNAGCADGQVLQVNSSAIFACSTLSLGQTNDGVNIGTGEADIFAGKSGVNLQFKTLLEGANISYVNGTSEITISAAGWQNNTGSNVGTGLGIYKGMNGDVLEFDSVIGGTGIDVTDTTDDFTISIDATVLTTGSSIHNLINVTNSGCSENQILKVNSSGIWDCSVDGGGNADKIEEGDSKAEVFDLGTGYIQLDLDGSMEYNFTNTEFDVNGNNIFFNNGFGLEFRNTTGGQNPTFLKFQGGNLNLRSNANILQTVGQFGASLINADGALNYAVRNDKNPPVANTDIANYNFFGKDSDNNFVTYTNIQSQMRNVTNGFETARMVFKVTESGTLNSVFELNSETDMIDFFDYTINANTNDIQDIGILNLNDATVLDVSGTTVTITQSYHNINNATGSAATLSTISGGTAGDMLIISADTGDTITVNNSGNILLHSGGPRTLTDDDTLMLIYEGTSWLEISYANNS